MIIILIEKTVMKKIYFADHEGWHRNTELCCDVKTFLRSDCITKIGKNYSGVLTHDAEGHFS